MGLLAKRNMTVSPLGGDYVKEASWGFMAIGSILLGLSIYFGWSMIVSLFGTGGYDLSSPLATAIVDILALYFIGQGLVSAYFYKKVESRR